MRTPEQDAAMAWANDQRCTWPSMWSVTTAHFAILAAIVRELEADSAKLRQRVEELEECVRSEHCACRPNAVVLLDGTRAKYRCLRCVTLGEK